LRLDLQQPGHTPAQPPVFATGAIQKRFPFVAGRELGGLPEYLIDPKHGMAHEEFPLPSGRQCEKRAPRASPVAENIPVARRIIR
jgi:hypothetical protein